MEKKMDNNMKNESKWWYIGSMHCRSVNNYQYHLEVCIRSPAPELPKEPRTMLWVAISALVDPKQGLRLRV